MSDAAVVEEPQSLVSPQPHQLLRDHGVQGLHSLKHGSGPPTQLSRGVDILRGNIRCELLLIAEIESNHCIVQRIQQIHQILMQLQ